MKILLIVFLFGFQLTCVESIKCYVCNSMDSKDKGCADSPPKDSFMKECDGVEDQRFLSWVDAIRQKSNNRERDYKFTRQSAFIKAYKAGYVSTQCLKMQLTVFESSGNKTQRVLRDCTGLVCKGDISKGGCRKVGTDSRVMGEVCYCGSDKCNSSHRRLHQNFWLNIWLPIIISFTFVLN